MCSTTASNYLCHNPLDVSHRCGEVFCSQSFEDFVINCTRCSKEFNLLSCSLFITHVKECTPELEYNHIVKEEKPILLTEAVNENNIVDVPTSGENLCPVMFIKVENVEVQNTSVEEVMLEDIKNKTDYQDEDDVTIDEIARRKKIEEIIDEYKKYPALWDASPKASILSESAKKYDYKQIRLAVNSKLKTNFNDKELRMQILKLRLTYKQVLESKEQIEKGITDGSALLDDLWYFDKISFIGAKSSDIEVEAVPSDDSDQDGFFKASDSHDEETPDPLSDDDNDVTDDDRNESTTDNLHYPTEPTESVKKLVLSLIEEYQHHPCLWDKNFYNTSIINRNDAYEDITKEVNTKCGTKFTVAEIKHKMIKLRYSYRRTLRKKEAFEKKHANSKKKYRSQLWYFDQIKFIGASMNDLPAIRPRKRKIVEVDMNEDKEEVKNEVEDEAELFERELLKTLIEEYKKQPILWAVKHYSNDNNARRIAYKQIVSVINFKFNTQFTYQDISQRIMTIRAAYRKRRKHESLGGLLRKNVWYDPLLSFIDRDSNDYHRENESFAIVDRDAIKNHVAVIGLYKCNVIERFVYRTTKIFEDTGGVRHRRRSVRLRTEYTGSQQIRLEPDSNLCRKSREVNISQKSGNRIHKNAGCPPKHKQPIIIVDQPDNLNVEPNKEDEETSRKRRKPSNREHVFHIIELYKAEPLLWDPSHRHYTLRNKRRKAIKKILSTLSAEHDCQITSAEFHYQINFLSNAYFRALKQEAAAKEGDKRLVIRPYYFDQMSFLEPFVDSKTSSKSKASIENFTFLTENKPLMIEFIKLYKEQSCLWDPKHKDRHNQLAITEAYNRIANMFPQNDVFITKTEVMSAIKFLHNTEIYSRKKLEFNDPSKSNEPPVWFYEHLQFLARVPRIKDIHCNHCGQYFRKMADYKQHRIEIVGDYPYKCSICNAGFKIRTKYYRHSITHNEQLICEECGFKTREKCNFEVHMRRHKGIKPFKCKHCDTAYVTSSELKGHLRTHSGEERFHCDACEKSFPVKSALNRHKLRHGTPNLKCNICLKDFYTKGNLQTHMISHSSERKYSCEVCCADYKYKKHLFRHQKLHTKQIKQE